jgi:Hint module
MKLIAWSPFMIIVAAVAADKECALGVNCFIPDGAGLFWHAPLMWHCRDDNFTCEALRVCFAPSSTVTITTHNGGEEEILLSQLQVNDRVFTGTGDFSKVIAFSTFSPVTGSDEQQGSQYIKITLESSTSIEMTPRHMIYVKGKKYPIEASNVRIGDYLIRKSPRTPDIMDKVVSLDYENLQGGISPITEAGTIVVNGIAASCYSNPLYQASEYVRIFGIPLIHRQVFAHMLKSPIRVFCNYISGDHCQVKDSQLPYKFPGHELVDKMHELAVKWRVEDLGEIAFAAIALAFILVETMMLHLTLFGTIGLLFILQQGEFTYPGIDDDDDDLRGDFRKLRYLTSFT